MTQLPCPFCKVLVSIIGSDHKGFKEGSCSHKFKFKKSKLEKEFDKKYIQTPWGLEKKV